MSRYQCPECGFIYDEKTGDAYQGYPPGTRFADLPDDYNCPDCSVRDKPDFVKLGDTETPASPR
jgi:rubredoxin